MKVAKYVCLSIMLTIVTIAGMFYSGLFSTISGFFGVVGCHSMSDFTHRFSIDAIESVERAYDFADNVMGTKKFTDFPTASIDRRNYAVGYFDKDWKHIGGGIAKSHCAICAGFDTYESRFAGFTYKIAEEM